MPYFSVLKINISVATRAAVKLIKVFFQCFPELRNNSTSFNDFFVERCS